MRHLRYFSLIIHSVFTDRDAVYIDFTQPKHLKRFQLDTETGCSICDVPGETALYIFEDLTGATCTTTPVQIMQLTVQ